MENIDWKAKYEAAQQSQNMRIRNEHNNSTTHS